MDKAGVAVGLATISVVGAAILFAAERVLTGPMDVIERHLGFSPDGRDYRCNWIASGDKVKRFTSCPIPSYTGKAFDVS